eukprot:627906-Prymnesium_polylepis.1
MAPPAPPLSRSASHSTHRVTISCGSASTQRAGCECTSIRKPRSRAPEGIGGSSESQKCSFSRKPRNCAQSALASPSWRAPSAVRSSKRNRSTTIDWTSEEPGGGDASTASTIASASPRRSSSRTPPTAVAMYSVSSGWRLLKTTTSKRRRRSKTSAG